MEGCRVEGGSSTKFQCPSTLGPENVVGLRSGPIIRSFQRLMAGKGRGSLLVIEAHIGSLISIAHCVSVFMIFCFSHATHFGPHFPALFSNSLLSVFCFPHGLHVIEKEKKWDTWSLSSTCDRMNTKDMHGTCKAVSD